MSKHWLKILFPLLFVLGLHISPRTEQLTRTLSLLPIMIDLDSMMVEITHLTNMLQIEPWRVNGWKELGRAEYNAGEWQMSIIAFTKAREFEPLSSKDEYILAQSYEQIKEYSRAIESYQTILDNGVESEEIYQKLTAIYRQLADYSGMENTLLAWATFQPDQAEVNYSLGSLLCLSQPEKARTFLEQSAIIDPSYENNVTYLTEAIDIIRKENDEAYKKVIIGRALGNANQWDLAQIAFEQATQLNPEYGDAWAFLGEARQQSGVSGYDALRTALELSPESIVVRSLMAVYWRRNGEPEKALGLLNSLHQEEPDEVIWVLEIGATTAEAGDIPLALDYYQQATNMDPTNGLYWRSLALFCAEHQIEVYTIGLPAARQALILAPEDVLALDTMGWLLLSQGDDRTAQRFFHHAEMNEPDNPLIQYHLSQLYLQRADLPKAFEHLKLTRQYAPEDSELYVLAERLLKQYFSNESLLYIP